jgi:hypothetical protein
MLVGLTGLSIAALACGGSGGDAAAAVTDTGGSVSASFEADEPTPSQGTVSMRQASHSNDVVTVRIDVTGATNLYGAGFDVLYDADTVQYVGYSAGSALERSPTGSVLYEIGSSTPGRVVVGLALVGNDADGINISGTAPLVHLTFRMTEAGAAPVIFDGIPALLDDQPEPQPIQGLSWFGGTIIGE